MSCIRYVPEECAKTHSTALRGPWRSIPPTYVLSTNVEAESKRPGKAEAKLASL